MSAVGGATQAPLRQTCVVPQSLSAAQRLPMHVPSSHWQPSALLSQYESAYMPRVAAVQSDFVLQAGSHCDVVVLQKKRCGSVQSWSAKQPPLPPPIPLSGVGTGEPEHAIVVSAIAAMRRALRKTA